LADDQSFASQHEPSHRALPIQNRYKDALRLELFRGAFGNNGHREKKCHSPSGAQSHCEDIPWPGSRPTRRLADKPAGVRLTSAEAAIAALTTFVRRERWRPSKVDGLLCNRYTSPEPLETSREPILAILHAAWQVDGPARCSNVSGFMPGGRARLAF
jgi:hypothetical protein